MTGNGVGAIVFTILSAFATFERERIAARIREVKQLKKAQGKFTGGKRAFGFEVVDGVKVPLPQEQIAIEKMVTMRSRGATYKRLANWLTNNFDREVTQAGVKHILSSQGVCG